MMVQSIKAQQSISFQDKKFTVVLTDTDELYMSIPAICDALQLDARAQIRRIMRTETIADGLQKLLIDTSGGQQWINCLRVAVIAEWLGGIRVNMLHNALQQALSLYQQELPLLAFRAFPNIQCQEQPSTLSKKESTFIEIQETPSLVIEERDPEKRALLANIPSSLSSQTHLVVASFDEDRAFRESCLASEEQWIVGRQDVAPFYLTSNQIQVYLGHPQQPLDLSLAHERISALGESTVLTARIALGLWNIRRDDRLLSENGSTAIRIEDIFEWRGIQKHSRPAYPGATRRITDGYESKYKKQVYLDFYYLQQCYLRGHYNRVDNGIMRQFIIDGPYARVSVVLEQKKPHTLWQEEEIVGFLFSPGDWITTYAGQALYSFAHIDKRIFQLHPQQDQLALRIALYLTERWCQQARFGNYQDPIVMIDLLKASMISIDYKNLTSRFAGRIEKALQKLFDQGILGDSPQCLSLIDKTRNWGDAWLSSLWCLPPHLEVIEHYQQMLPAPKLIEQTSKRKKRDANSV